MIRPRHLAALLTIGCLVAPAFGQDRAEIDPTKIIGNRELPKVLYIVPWKRPLPTELVGRPPTSLLDEVLSPIDRDVFERQVRYHSLMQASPPDAGSGPKNDLFSGEKR